MNPIEERRRLLNRRQFFGRATGSVAAGVGVGALASLLARDGRAAEAPRRPHHAARARRVIYLHMMGGPSQLDLFDHKPALREHAGEDLRAMPDVYQDQRITGMTSGQSTLPLVPSTFSFEHHANDTDGIWVSELFPHTAAIAGELTFIRSMHTEAINHEPGVCFMQTGSQIPGRPSIGAWLGYGLGSANDELPAFVVLISQGFGNMQPLSTRLWSSGFLPGEHQGVRLRSADDPVLFLNDPPGVRRADRRRMLDLVGELNEAEFRRSGDPEVRTRIAQAEMAFRMQMSVPDLTDFSGESDETLALYGDDVRKPGTFAANCLLARRLAERDVRFV
ncbi:MAG: DUF1501 domain-containing protein, partial [Planctomycetota bacterium JB042]